MNLGNSFKFWGQPPFVQSMLLINIFCFSIFKNHHNNSTIFGQYVESNKQDFLEEGSLSQATMANRQSPKTPSNDFVVEAPEPSKGLAYTPNSSQKIPSSHTVIPSLYQTQDVHHTTKTKRIQSQGKQIMSKKEELEAACYSNLSFEDLCLDLGMRLPSGIKIPKFTKYNGRECPYMHLWRYCNDIFQVGKDERILIHIFASGLEGQALRWFLNLDRSKLQTWIGLSRAFWKHFKFNLDFLSESEMVRPKLFDDPLEEVDMVSNLPKTPGTTHKVIAQTCSEFPSMVQVASNTKQAIWGNWTQEI